MTEPIRGVFLVRSHFGYDVEVDGRAFGLDVSWTAANAIAKVVAKHRPAGDSRGYAKCGHKACWKPGRCIKFPTRDPRSHLLTTVEEYEMRKRLKDG